MASTIKVDQIEGSTGSTVTVPTGQTLVMTDGLAQGSLPVVGVAKGGTNIESFAAGDLLYATGSTTLAKLTKGTAEQVLAMNAGATAPDWGSVDLTVLPTITVAKGGTNLESFTAGDILYATGATTLAKLAKGTASQQLAMNAGATAPEWIEASGGIAEFDMWRWTTNVTSDQEPLASNWERCDTSFDKIGTGMSESSGIFSFPSTGIWLITAGGLFLIDGELQNCKFKIDITTDNSSYTTVAENMGSIFHAAQYNTMEQLNTDFAFDVTNVSNDKCRFSVYASNWSEAAFVGSTDVNKTYAIFTRIGDT